MPRRSDLMRTHLTPIDQILTVTLISLIVFAALLVWRQVTDVDLAAKTIHVEAVERRAQRAMIPALSTASDVEPTRTISAHETLARSTTTSEGTPEGTPSPETQTPTTQVAVVPTIVPPTVATVATAEQSTEVPAEPTDTTALQQVTTRLRIPSIGVDASVEVRGLDDDGVMQAPQGPDVISWYDFSSHPGGDGNAVFAGHLDYAGYGPAVFWRLGELQPGDLIEVHQQDGVIFRYQVTAVRPFAATDEATDVVASAGHPAITLITCEGTFHRDVGAYDERLVVSGDRID